MKLIKSLIPYILFATMTYLGTRYAFPTWTEEGNGSITWVEEDGGTKQTYKLFDYHVIFSSSIQLPTALGSITGAGVGTGFDADKLDGQDGTYYLNASSGTDMAQLLPNYLSASSGTIMAQLLPNYLSASSGTTIVATILSTMTTAGAYIATKLNASSGTTICTLLDTKLSASSGTTISNDIVGRLPASSGTIIADIAASKLAASSGTTIAGDILGRLPASSGTVIVATILSTMTAAGAYIATKLNASSGTTIAGDIVGRLSASSGTVIAIQLQNYQPTQAFAVFGSTDLVGDMCVSTQIAIVNSDFNIVGWDISGDVSGSCVITVSSRGFADNFGRIDGTDVPDLYTQNGSSSTALTGWTTNVGKGGRIKFTLISASTVRSLTIALRALR